MDTKTVLVVDDDAAIVEFLRAALEEHGYAVLSAVGGEALPLARTAHPAVVLLDVMMPGMDGMEVSRRLRADAATAHIPIIAMSAAYRLWEAAPLLMADDVLAKPFHCGDLCATVERWMPDAA